MSLDIQGYFDRGETQYLTHSFHPYPNKFIPQIVGAAIEEFSDEGDVIIDSFCGSGTTLVEANLLRRNCIGVDLNPLACLISRVKTTPLEIGELKPAVGELLENLYSNLNRAKLDDFSKAVDPEIPEFPNREYWFQENALVGLGILKALINRIEDGRVRDFCRVAMSLTVKQVSNASSLYHLTRLKNLKRVDRLDVYRKFERKIRIMIKVMEDYRAKASPNQIEIRCGDARELRNLNEVDCVITNPPNFLFDYFRCFKIYFWWLGLGDILEFDKRMIGTKRVNSKPHSLGVDFVDELVSQIEEKNNLAAAALSKYYSDMGKVFGEIYRLLKNGGYCCIYTSDPKLYGITIRCPDTFCELARQAGFEVEDRVRRVVPRRAIIFATEKTEEFLIFKK